MQEGGASHACAGVFVNMRGMQSRALSCNAVLTGATGSVRGGVMTTWIEPSGFIGRLAPKEKQPGCATTCFDIFGIFPGGPGRAETCLDRPGSPH